MKHSGVGFGFARAGPSRRKRLARGDLFLPVARVKGASFGMVLLRSSSVPG
jgi:hypothetical protein